MLTPNARNVTIPRPFFDDSQKRIAVWHQPKIGKMQNRRTNMTGWTWVAGKLRLKRERPQVAPEPAPSPKARVAPAPERCPRCNGQDSLIRQTGLT